MSKQGEKDSFHKISETKLKPLPFSIEWKVNGKKPFPFFVPQVWVEMNRRKVSSVLEKVEKELENIPLYNARTQNYTEII